MTNPAGSAPSGESWSSEDWDRLSARALWQLEHPDELPPLGSLDGLALHLRLWIYRQHGAHLSWGLFVPASGGGRALVREVQWDAVADLQRSRSRSTGLKRRSSAEPDMRVRDAIVDEARLAPFLEEAPQVLSERFGLQVGEADRGKDVLGIAGYRSLTHARLEWEGEGPAEGGDAVAWTMRLRRLLEASLREREKA